MAAQIAPDLEESIKEYITKTMKEVKRDTNKAPSVLMKKPSKEEAVTPISQQLNPSLNTEELLTDNHEQNMSNKNENLMDVMEIEEEKAPLLKPNSSKNLGMIADKKRKSVSDDIKMIENLLK